ncbi:HAMP domain-containing sensor histidine kinase [Vibrio furnissii]|uniref:sensor histidine kinase n=1 Tax=Vibrio furnissii TaxID=29494 RepID=UPI0024BBAA23|nr:HAMP domain-containing sensor histidine kinase [Vibrio furnissii]WHR53488.1 HAMP domain-containing sensor histidine kinase [Vibrio furnissii]
MDMLIIFKLYLLSGLAFFAAAFAIFSRNLKNSSNRIAQLLPIFALFGLVHAFHIWSELYFDLYQHEFILTRGIDTFRVLKLGLSFLPLAYFAWRMLPLSMWSQRQITLIKKAIVLFLFVFVVSVYWLHHHYTYPVFIHYASNHIRWVLGLGFSSLAGLAVYSYADRVEFEGYGSPGAFKLLGLALIAYAFSTGFLTDDAALWVQIIRLLCGYGILLSLWNAMRVFDQEHDQQLQSALQLSLQDAKLRELGELTSAIAHEIKTPLSSALMSCDLLEHQLAHDSNHKRQIDRIRYGLGRAAEISQEVLNYAHHKAIHRQPVRLAEIVDQALSLNQYRLEGFDVLVNVDSTLSVYGDAGLLEEVFTNLIGNSVDASTTHKSLRIQGFQNKLNAILTFTDCGGGMPDALLAKATQPFFTTKPKGEGTGMGLALCKQIISQHNGELLLYNHDNGLTVEVRIPRKMQ